MYSVPLVQKDSQSPSRPPTIEHLRGGISQTHLPILTSHPIDGCISQNRTRMWWSCVAVPCQRWVRLPIEVAGKFRGWTQRRNSPQRETGHKRDKDDIQAALLYVRVQPRARLLQGTVLALVVWCLPSGVIRTRTVRIH